MKTVLIVVFMSIPILMFGLVEASPLLGGEASVKPQGRNSFSQPSANMPLMRKVDFSVGNSFFKNPWVIAPATTTARDGVGPLFNTNACENCHIKDGRGHPPENNNDNAVSMLVRLSVPADEKTKHLLKTHGVVPEPNYGGQLQDFSIQGVEAEAQIELSYQTTTVELAGGEQVQLRKPKIVLKALAYGEMSTEVMMSLRIAPPMIGLGLLEAVPAKTLLEYEDVTDANADGISGKANRVWSIVEKATTIGRFGWKAGQPSLRQQNAAAFNGDLGITSTLFEADGCTAIQNDCRNRPTGGTPEVDNNILGHVTFYSRNLAVPVQRDYTKAEVVAGAKIFEQLSCDACHRITMRTAVDFELPWLAGQTIYPYTDLLLHDMGDGLADHRPEFIANGFEWRTPPLWGIGLTKEVNGHSQFLHDGRAQNIQEAILWHGGEAESSRIRYVNLTSNQRSRLLQFLNSL